jgi:hypothetical protein
VKAKDTAASTTDSTAAVRSRARNEGEPRSSMQ